LIAGTFKSMHYRSDIAISESVIRNSNQLAQAVSG
jgi:hypothetical protein